MGPSCSKKSPDVEAVGGTEGQDTEGQSVEGLIFEGSGSSKSDQDVVVRSETAEIKIPAGALKEEVEVTITEEGFDPSQVKGEVVSKRVILGFPRPQMAAVPLSVSLKTVDGVITGQAVPNDDGTNRVVLAMVKVEGNAFPAGEVNREAWFPVMTRWDGATGTYLFNLFATAEKISVVLVVRNDAVIHVEPLQESPLSKLRNLFLPALSYAQGGNAPDAQLAAATWGERRWEVVCFHPDPAARQEICNFGERGTPGHTLVEALELATREFAGEMGFRAHVQLGEYMGEIVNSAIVEQQNLCGGQALACYYQETGVIAFLPATFNSRFPIPMIAAHELFHAVESGEGLYARLNNFDCDGWVTEGLAEFMGSLQAGDNLALNPAAYGYRNWRNPLYSEEALNEYQASEFWSMIVDNDPTYVKKLVQTMMGTEGCYGGADKALQEGALGTSLSDAFLNAMVKYRSQDPNYGSCREKLMVDAALNVPKRFEGESLWPMSAQCYAIISPQKDFKEVSFSVKVLADPGQPSAMVVGEESLHLRGNQEGTIIREGRQDFYRLWVLNLHKEAHLDFKNFEVEVTFKRDLVGVWRGQTPHENDFLKIDRDQGAYRVSAYLGVCELATRFYVPLSLVGNTIDFVFPRESFTDLPPDCLSGCGSKEWRFSLSLQGNQLTGVVKANEPDTGEHEQFPISFENTSDNPNVVVPNWRIDCGSDNLDND